MNLFRRRPIERSDKSDIKRTLNGFDLTFMGVGCVVGSGIFVLTGVAAATAAGPAIIFSFIIGAITCIFAGLCYAEVSSAIPASGSVYSYSYVCIGEFIAHLMGCMMIAVYIITAATVISGWSSYLEGFLVGTLNISIPEMLSKKPTDGGLFDLPAVIISGLMGLLLIRGTTENKVMNNIFVATKISVVILFIVVGAFYVNTSNWSPFMPFGVKGVFAGGSLVFFAYIGFDAISTSAEETKDPQKNLPIGILGALFISTLLYILVSLVLTGILKYTELNQSNAVAYVLYAINQNKLASIISVGAIIGLLAGIFAFIYASSRIVFAMSRDGLLPGNLSKLNKSNSPSNAVILVTIVIATLSGIISTKSLAELANIGVTLAFLVVGICVMILRIKYPEINKDGFKTPAWAVVCILNTLLCLVLLYNLPYYTWLLLIGWFGLSAILYFTYSIKNLEKL